MTLCPPPPFPHNHHHHQTPSHPSHLSLFALSTWIQIVCPEIEAIFGELQYALLMAIIFENMAEPPSMGKPSQDPNGKPGVPYPAAPPLPELLGIAGHMMPAAWGIEVLRRFANVYIIACPIPYH